LGMFGEKGTKEVKVKIWYDQINILLLCCL
jgi:hypothetical protein